MKAQQLAVEPGKLSREEDPRLPPTAWSWRGGTGTSGWWRQLFAGDSDGARSLPPPYVLTQLPDEVRRYSMSAHKHLPFAKNMADNLALVQPPPHPLYCCSMIATHTSNQLESRCVGRSTPYSAFSCHRISLALACTS